MAQWIRPRTLNREVPGSNLLKEAVVPFGKALYPHCLVPRKGLKEVCPLVCLLFISNRISYEYIMHVILHVMSSLLSSLCRKSVNHIPV